MGQQQIGATASTTEPVADREIDRRTMLRRLAATSAVAWIAPEVLATTKASAMALSGCYTEYNFDDGSLQGWVEDGGGPSRFRLSTLHTFSGSHSVWFGAQNANDSLHPIVGQPTYNRGRSSRSTLTSPVTTAASTDFVSFTVRLAIENAVQYDLFRLFIVQGGTRVELWNKHMAGFSVIDHPEDPAGSFDLYTTFGGWVEIHVPVGTPPGIDLANPVQFEFDFQTVDRQLNRTEGVYLDNILLPCSGAATGPQAAIGGSILTDDGSGLQTPRPTNSYLPGYRAVPRAPEPEREVDG